MAEGFREVRVADRVRRELSEVLATRVSDPRLQRVRVLRVQVSGDLQIAWVFLAVSATDDKAVVGVDVNALTRVTNEEKKRILKGLESARGRLRTLVAKRLKLRRVPELRFSFDEAIDEQARIEALLEQVKNEAMHSHR